MTNGVPPFGGTPKEHYGVIFPLIPGLATNNVRVGDGYQVSISINYRNREITRVSN